MEKKDKQGMVGVMGFFIFLYAVFYLLPLEKTEFSNSNLEDQCWRKFSILQAVPCVSYSPLLNQILPGKYRYVTLNVQSFCCT